MIANLRQSVQQAFFRSIEQAGCLSLQTDGPDSSDDGSESEDYDEYEDEPDGVLTPTKVVGFANILRNVPKTDKFVVEKFHHVEFACADATCTYQRFSWGLGMPLVAKSDLTTGNITYSSYVIKSNDLVFIFSAPLSEKNSSAGSRMPWPFYSSKKEKEFFSRHGFAVRALAVQVGDVEEAFAVSVNSGAIPITTPVVLVDNASKGKTIVAEVKLYGDVLLRLVQNVDFNGAFLPNYEAASNQIMSYGLRRLDHAVGNVPKLAEVVDYITSFSGFHRFLETEDDGGEVDAPNQVVLANNFETVLLPIIEPALDDRGESAVEGFLEHNRGPGLQHLALMCTDIVHTVQEMKARSGLGGFEFMPVPSPEYYKDCRTRVGRGLSEKLLNDCQDLGISIGTDDKGILLQIFTKPVGDRPTFFLEVIQRIGGVEKGPDGMEYQRGGCGGFGKANLVKLLRSLDGFDCVPTTSPGGKLEPHLS